MTNLKIMEMDCLRRDAKLSRRDRVRNDETGIRMSGKGTIMEKVERKGLK
jgi:hypothetical protein